MPMQTHVAMATGKYCRYRSKSYAVAFSTVTKRGRLNERNKQIITRKTHHGLIMSQSDVLTYCKSKRHTKAIASNNLMNLRVKIRVQLKPVNVTVQLPCSVCEGRAKKVGTQVQVPPKSGTGSRCRYYNRMDSVRTVQVKIKEAFFSAPTSN